jgi:hypothetical protein
MDGNQLSQAEPPIHGRHRGWQIRLIHLNPVQCRANTLIQLVITQRDEPGQQQRSATVTDKGISYRCNGAIVGKQNHAARQCQGFTAMPVNDPGDQRIGKGKVYRDGVNTGAKRLGHAAPLNQLWIKFALEIISSRAALCISSNYASRR